MATATSRSNLGRYQVLESLGVGGMGEVLLAVLHGAGSFEKRVAIKRVLPHLSSDEDAVTAFLAEAALTARISHPNVCQVHAIEAIDGEYFMVMEFLDGIPLSEVVRDARRAKRAIPVNAVCEIIRQACEGLHAAHELSGDSGRPLNLVHRDVSPSNFMITKSGIVKVLDFGIAKTHDSGMTEAGALKGKIPYMSPEQVRSQPLDRRSDVFALGTCLYELLTLVSPFRRNSPYDSANAIIECKPDSVENGRLGLPASLSKVIDKAMSPERDDRFASALEMAQALERVQGDDGMACSAATLAAFVVSTVASRAECTDTRVSAAPCDSASGDTAPRRTARRDSTPGYTERLEVVLGEEGETDSWKRSLALRPAPAPEGEISEEDKKKTSPMRRASPGATAPVRPPSAPVPYTEQAFENTPPMGFHALHTPNPYGATGAGAAMQFPPSGIQPLQGTMHGTGPMYVLPHPTANRALWAAVALVAVAGVLVLFAAQASQKNGLEASTAQPAHVVEPNPLPAAPVASGLPTVGDVMESQHGEFLSCFGRYTDSTVGSPEVQLVVSVRRTGAVESVRVLPADIEATALGTCLAEVAGRLHFPTIRTETSFQVPLRVTADAP